MEQPDQVATLHQRASAWYERHGSANDAIRHALAAQDFARAADLIEMAWTAVRRSRQDAALLGWLKALPDEVLRARPVLDEAERLYMSDFSPNVRPIAALKARVWLAQGRLGEALDWARAGPVRP